ncbi:MAG: UDP-N-acetylmuramate dehydrogenase [Desulfarculaceae bacterium]
MSAELANLLTQRLGDRARFGQPMSSHTTWGVGGQAWCVCQVHSAEEAAFVIEAATKADMPWMTLGRGSNLLVLDQGYQGVMLRLAGPLARIRRVDANLLAEGGAFLPAVVKFAARLGLTGMEWAAGIPATVGGAVATNAGAAGRDMSQVVEDLRLLMPGGRVEEHPASCFPAAYRRRQLPAGSLVLSANLSLIQDDPLEVQNRTEEMLNRRRRRQPQEQHTAGSVFKNPPGDFAGRLIEQAGCKGLKIGDAMVSHHHANFIENLGRARASDVMALMEKVKQRVQEKTGIELEPEVEMVGFV